MKMRRLLCKALDIFSIIIERDLVKIRNKINILEDIELICSQQFQTVDRSPYDCVSIRKNLIDMGLRILFIIFFCKVLSSFILAPTQLSPNSFHHFFYEVLSSFKRSYMVIFLFVNYCTVRGRVIL